MKKIEKKKITEEQKEAWFDAAKVNDIETVQRMLEEGFGVNIKDGDGWTALHLVCYWGKAEIAKLLIDNGVDVNAQADDLRIPLHLACAWGYVDIAKLLIDNGANITVKNNDGNTPLDYLKRTYPQKYQKLMEWITEKYPEKLLEYMASESVQSRGVGL